MPDIVIIIRYILDFLNTVYKEYKQNERQKSIDKIKDSPKNAWNDKFASSDNWMRNTGSGEQ